MWNDNRSTTANHIAQHSLFTISLPPSPPLPLQKPVRYRRAVSYDSKEYYMRLLCGNPGMYQHSVEQSTEETTHHEPEHGEDTIARVKGGGGQTHTHTYT